MKSYVIIGIALAILTQMVATRYVRADDRDDHGDVRLITGPINADGTLQVPSNAFTVAHPGTGHYVITFAPDVFGKKIPSCMIIPLGVVSLIGLHEYVSYCDIQLSADAIFNFMAAPITLNIDLSH